MQAGSVQHETFGFAMWRGKPTAMAAAHAHTEVELNLMLAGSATYFLAGRFQSLAKDRLAVFWAGQPHQLVKASAETEFIWVTIPVAWLWQWQIAPAFIKHLLAGELVLDQHPCPTDRELFARWVGDMKSRALRPIVLLEVEARLRRLALHAKPQRPPRALTGGLTDRLTEFVGRHYLEEISIPQIAATAQVHPNYATQSFKRSTGMSLWDYVIRLRVSHAQRLLLTTDGKVLDVALASGFRSASRFYVAFQRYTGTTPDNYRLRHR